MSRESSNLKYLKSVSDKVEKFALKDSRLSSTAKAFNVSASSIETFMRSQGFSFWKEYVDSVLKKKGVPFGKMDDNERLAKVKEYARDGLCAEHCAARLGIGKEHLESFVRRKFRPDFTYERIVSREITYKMLEDPKAIEGFLAPYFKQAHTREKVARMLDIPVDELSSRVQLHFKGWFDLCSKIDASFPLSNLKEITTPVEFSTRDVKGCNRLLEELVLHHGSGDKYELDIPAQYHMKMSAVQELQERFYESEERVRAA
ncbi:hypothetical protein [Pseudovibrio exalbescens]|uniref:hypothetical protein n=1 Tax=Pseudovibrio exalbescens TaxID=197461 RepID=UPI000C9BC8A8|nr:hypothetical protein [Pseudovibrio exalbescens]